MCNEDIECVCQGNWRNFVKESEPLMGQIYRNKHGDELRFIGLLWALDDFYYTFRVITDMNKNSCTFISCVMSFDMILKHEGLEKI